MTSARRRSTYWGGPLRRHPEGELPAQYRRCKHVVRVHKKGGHARVQGRVEVDIDGRAEPADRDLACRRHSPRGPDVGEVADAGERPARLGGTAARLRTAPAPRSSRRPRRPMISCWLTTRMTAAAAMGETRAASARKRSVKSGLILHPHARSKPRVSQRNDRNAGRWYPATRRANLSTCGTSAPPG